MAAKGKAEKDVEAERALADAQREGGKAQDGFAAGGAWGLSTDQQEGGTGKGKATDKVKKGSPYKKAKIGVRLLLRSQGQAIRYRMPNQKVRTTSGLRLLNAVQEQYSNLPKAYNTALQNPRPSHK